MRGRVMERNEASQKACRGTRGRSRAAAIWIAVVLASACRSDDIVLDPNDPAPGVNKHPPMLAPAVRKVRLGINIRLDPGTAEYVTYYEDWTGPQRKQYQQLIYTEVKKALPASTRTEWANGLSLAMEDGETITLDVMREFIEKRLDTYNNSQEEFALELADEGANKEAEYVWYDNTWECGALFALELTDLGDSTPTPKTWQVTSGDGALTIPLTIQASWTGGT